MDNKCTHSHVSVVTVSKSYAHSNTQKDCIFTNCWTLLSDAYLLKSFHVSWCIIQISVFPKFTHTEIRWLTELRPQKWIFCDYVCLAVPYTSSCAGNPSDKTERAAIIKTPSVLVTIQYFLTTRSLEQYTSGDRNIWFGKGTLLFLSLALSLKCNPKCY